MTLPAIEILTSPLMPTFQPVGGDRYHIFVTGVETVASDVVVATVMYDTLGGRGDQSVTGISSPTLGAFTHHSTTPYINAPAGSDPGMAIETWYAPVTTQLSSETVTVTIGGVNGADSAFCVVFGVTNTSAPYFDDLGGTPLISISPGNGGAEPALTYSTAGAGELVVALQGAEATAVSGSSAPAGTPGPFTALAVTPNNYNGRQLGMSISSYQAASAVVGGSITSSINTAPYPNSFLFVYAFQGLIFTVPNVIGDTLSAANAAIAAASLVTGTVISVPNAAPAGTVIIQSPVGGTVVTAGSSVNLTLSLGLATTGTTPLFLNDEFIGGAYVNSKLTLVEFTYLPERQPFLEGPTSMIINRYKQEPQDSRQRGVDYTFFVVPGEEIQTVEVTGISAQGVPQAATNPLVTPLVITDLIIDPATGIKFAYTASGGQDGIEYTVQFTTTTQIQTSTVEEVFSINILIEDMFP